jgi:hypothetical protein
MAWLTQQDAATYLEDRSQPDMDTLSYWLARLEPLIRAEAEGEIIVVLANRSGVEDEAVYAGSSAVLGITHGEVSVYGILGRGESELLVVDTSASTSRNIADAKNSEITQDSEDDVSEPEEHPLSIEEIMFGVPIVPVSPVEPRFTHAYFDTSSLNEDDRRASLISSGNTAETIFHSRSPSPSAMSPKRPASSNPLEDGHVEKFARQQSPPSTNVIAAEEDFRPLFEQMKASPGKLGPHSASDAVPQHSWDGTRGLSPIVKEADLTPRPRSTGW